MKKVRFWFLLLLLGFGSSAFSQSFPLRLTIDSFTTPLPDSLYLGSDYNYSIRIYNDSSAQFMDTLVFNYKIDTTSFGAPTLNGGLEYPVFIYDTIDPFSYIIVDITAHVDGPAFKAGPSVVVIWPVAPFSQNIYYVNPLIDSFIVFEPNGIADLEPGTFRLNYHAGNLYLFTDNINTVNRVRIYDMQGRAITEQLSPSNKIPFPPLQAGVYFVEVLCNNKRQVLRFQAYN